MRVRSKFALLTGNMMAKYSLVSAAFGFAAVSLVSACGTPYGQNMDKGRSTQPTSGFIKTGRQLGSIPLYHRYYDFNGDPVKFRLRSGLETEEIQVGVVDSFNYRGQVGSPPAYGRCFQLEPRTIETFEEGSPSYDAIIGAHHRQVQCPPTLPNWWSIEYF